MFLSKYYYNSEKKTCRRTISDANVVSVGKGEDLTSDMKTKLKRIINNTTVKIFCRAKP